jgi:ABC-type nitrate/sulfonate/bicarbonate transport system substrate-binding protein
MGSTDRAGDDIGGIGGRGHRLSRRAFLGNAAGAVVASGAAASLLAACGGQAKGGSGGGGGNGTDKITFLTIIPLNLGFISEVLGIVNGRFKQQGLDVTIQSTRGSAQALQSILQGSALITRAGAIETVQHNAQAGAPLVDIGMQWRKAPIALVSSPQRPMRVPADWRGKKVGLPSKGGTSEIIFNLMLASQGVPIDSVQRQVTGFSVGTYDLVKKGRVAGYVIGSVEQVLIKLQQPDAVVVDPSKWVEEGQPYLTSQRQLAEKRDQLKAYMTVVKSTMDDVLNDQDKKYATIIAAVKKKYDFEELKDDKVAQGVLQGQVDAWSYGGAQPDLKTVTASWQKVYDQLVRAKIVEGGKNPQEWFTNDLVT